MLATFILSTALFWACLHALIHLFGLQRTSNTPLPFAHSRRGGADLPAWTNRVKYDARTQITLKDVRLNISTGRLNDAHSSLASSLRHDPARNVVKAFYNLGAIIGATFTIISPVVLALIVVWMAAPLFQRNVAPAASPSHMKRSNVGETEPLATSQTRLQLLIPGLTTPLFHLPVTALALFVCLVVHEAGHAVCAAIDAVPMLSAGFSLFYVLPSAFVSLSSSSLEVRLPWPRIRIAAAGAWHNLVFWAMLWLTASLGLTQLVGNVIAWPFWRNVEGSGRAVIHIDTDSPLKGILRLGSIIESINYVDVATQGQWDGLFTRDAVPSMSGWCLPRRYLAEQPAACCAGEPTDGLMSCFVEDKGLNAMSRCLDPFLALDPLNASRPPSVPTQIERCESLCHDAEFACLHLRAEDQLLRISNIPFGTRYQRNEVLLWRGPPSEIWNHVEVGDYQPRSGLVPLYGPTIAQLFFRYLSIITASLSLINLVPAPILDGAEVFRTTMEVLQKRTSGEDENDLEAHSMPIQGAGGSVEWPGLVSTAVAWASTGMLLCIGLLSLFQ